tara:strand:+ start:184 stop:903 length:720 start_codon:yes stop_codon:yes gene_type:complete
MSITTTKNGRLCNQIIRNLALSIIAKQNNLHVIYSNFDNIHNKLGIELFTGNDKYQVLKNVYNNNYINYLNQKEKIECNLNFMNDYFQTEEITTYLYKYIRLNNKQIEEKNPYKSRYNNNNDLFIHIRLTDSARHNPGIKYYINSINSLKYDSIYIGSDDFNHHIINQLKTQYPDINFVKKNPVNTIQFGSTCKHIILSHGSFSAVIGYLAFYSNVYYPDFEPKWCPLGLFLNKGFVGN